MQGSSGADDRGRVAALDLKSGARRWIWEAEPGQRIAALAADRGSVVDGLTGDPISIGSHYRQRLVQLNAVVGIDLASGGVRWTSPVVDVELLPLLIGGEREQPMSAGTFGHAPCREIGRRRHGASESRRLRLRAAGKKAGGPSPVGMKTPSVAHACRWA